MAGFCRYQIILTKVGSYLLKKSKCFGGRHFSLEVREEKKRFSKNFIPFMEMIQMRRDQAARSIIVQVQSSQSYKELYSYCHQIGRVKEMFHYAEGTEKQHFIIIEFCSESDVDNILAESTHLEDFQTVPAYSQFLWFRAANKKSPKLTKLNSANLSIENGTHIIADNDFTTEMNHCKTISDQISKLHQLTRLNDIGQRLRFLTARQVESTISGLFPKVCAYPFGSSVNGFGKMGCDLDLVLRLAEQKDNGESRLVYHCKAGSGSERTTSQKNMEVIGDLINLFLPGCTQVRRILQARVPIIKYLQQLTNVECDLSMTNMSGVYMSDFLYLMGELDERVRPLTFAIRKWAKEVMLTHSTPGRWITNFSLTLMTLSFLQKPLHSPPILPTLNHLTKLAGSEDQYITEDGINCSFLRNIRKLNFKTENNSSLEDLLLEFFEFYSQFDFTNRAICLNEAVSITKPEYSPLYIVNPLERGLNVSKNVSLEEVERFKVEVRNAAWLLESQDITNGRHKGLLAIFQNKNKLSYNLNFTTSNKQNRLMEVSTLFTEEDVDQDSKKHVFKNGALEKQVNKIKKDTKDIIKSLEVESTRRKSRR